HLSLLPAGGLPPGRSPAAGGGPSHADTARPGVWPGNGPCQSARCAGMTGRQRRAARRRRVGDRDRPPAPIATRAAATMPARSAPVVGSRPLLLLTVCAAVCGTLELPVVLV